MKILFLNAYFQPEQIASSHLEDDLLSALSKEDIYIDVITPIPTRGIDKSVREKYTKKKKEVLYSGKVNVRRFWAPQEHKSPWLRMFRYVWCNYRTFSIAKKYKSIDVVYAGSTPPTQGLLAAKVRKRLEKSEEKKVRFVYNLQDIFPDSMVNANMTKEGTAVWKIGRRIENYTYKCADRIITISEDFKRNIVNKGVNEEKITIVPNWINTEKVFPIERNENILFDRYKLQRDCFYICYSGNIGHSQNIDLLLNVAKQLQEENIDIQFILIGDGAAKEEVARKIEENHIENLKLLPYQDYSEIAHVFSLGDVGLIISKPGIGSSSVPSKTWGIMAAKRPVLASFDTKSELSKIIQNKDCGIIAEAGDAEALLSAIKEMYTDNNKRECFANNGYNYVHYELDKDRCVTKCIEAMTK